MKIDDTPSIISTCSPNEYDIPAATKAPHMFPGIILCMRPANERRRYNVTSSLIGWAHTQIDLCVPHHLTDDTPPRGRHRRELREKRQRPEIWWRHTWTRSLHYWPFGRGIHWPPSRRAFMLSFLGCYPKQATEQTVELLAVWDAMTSLCRVLSRKRWRMVRDVQLITPLHWCHMVTYI